MKKLLFVLALSSLFVACNNEKTVHGGTGYLVPYPPDSSHTYPFTNTLIDSTLAKGYVASLDSLITVNLDSLLTGKKADTAIHTFIIDADALLHAITDSPNISHVIFYMGRKNDTLNLMYLPARAVYEQDNPKPIDYNEITFGNMVFDQSVPCPTCAKLKGPMQPVKNK